MQYGSWERMKFGGCKKRAIVLKELNKIVHDLKLLTNNDPLEYLYEKYKWFNTQWFEPGKTSYPYLNNLSARQINYFRQSGDRLGFEKNIAIKLLTKNYLEDNTDDIANTYLWIVKIWGGIGTIKKENLLKDIQNESRELERISSWSKILSFTNPHRDVIYDSKVIYSMNWLLLKSGHDGLYLRQPASRNKNLMLFHLAPIINIKFQEKIYLTMKGDKSTKDVYVQGNKCYEVYRNSIEKINVELWGEKVVDLDSIGIGKIQCRDYPFFTEMLLFTMADQEIVDDIRSSVLVTVGKK